MGLPASSDEFDCVWAEWMAGGGNVLEAEIHETIKKTAHLLDMTDGTHASWHDGRLGVLVVFDSYDVASVLSAWEAAEGGNLMALTHIMEWLKGFVNFVDYCVTEADPGPEGLFEDQ